MYQKPLHICIIKLLDINIWNLNVYEVNIHTNVIRMDLKTDHDIKQNH